MLMVLNRNQYPCRSLKCGATINAVTQQKFNGNNEIHLSLSIEELIDRQNNDTFNDAIIKLVNDKKVPPDK